MDRGERLFSKYDFQAAVSNAASALTRAIAELDDARLFHADQQKLVNQLVAAHGISVPVLDLDAMTPSQREVDIDLSGDPRERFMRDLSGPYYVKGTEISFRVPYRGEAEVFYCRPSTFSFNPPYAHVEGETIIVRITRQDQNAAEYRRSFDSTITQIQTALSQLRSDCAGLDDKLRATATNELAKRRDKREKDRGLIDALGLRRPQP